MKIFVRDNFFLYFLHYLGGVLCIILKDSRIFANEESSYIVSRVIRETIRNLNGTGMMSVCYRVGNEYKNTYKVK